MLRGTGLATDEYSLAIVNLLEQALELDPDFAEAWALMANVDGDMYWFTFDRTPERLAHMKHAVDRAIALNPDSPDALSALAEYYYRGSYNYPKALEYLERAYEIMPNNSEVLYNMALTLRRLGRWSEAVDRFEEAAALDPADVRTYQEVLNTAIDSRDPRAEKWNEELGRRFPTNSSIAGMRAVYYLSMEGDVTAAAEALAMAPASSDWYYQRASYEIPLWQGDYETAVDKVLKGREVLDLLAPGTTDVWAGWALTLAGEDQRAGEYLAAGVALLEAELEKPYSESYVWPHMIAAIGYGLQGRHEPAVAACDRAQQILPERIDKVHGVNVAVWCAVVKGWAGDTEFLVSEMERLWATGSENLTPETVRHDPRWDFIRDHPRVQALLQKP
jgi:tetratricopeptide (TPR) repeat protein